MILKLHKLEAQNRWENFHVRPLAFKAMHCPHEAISFAKMDWQLAKNRKRLSFCSLQRNFFN